MRVLLIQSYLGRKESRGAIFPLGLCYIATAIKEHKTQLIDLNLCRSPYDDLKNLVNEFQPEIAGISIRNIDTTQYRDIFYYFKTIRPTARLIKEINPSIKIVLGGPGFSIFANEIMRKVPEADFGVYLEGEESMPELLDNLHQPDRVKGIFIRENENVKYTGRRELPNFTHSVIPQRELTAIDQYSDYNIGIQTKRGCVLSCAYCSYPFLNGTTMRLRSAASIVDEIEYITKDLKVKKFMFVDSVFNVPKRHAEAICQEILDRGLNVEWSAWFDIKFVTKEILQLAQNAGCKEIGFSPDGLSNKTLKALRKGFTNKDIMRSIKIVKELKGLKVGYGFFIAAPKQDLFGFLRTIYLFFKIPLTLFRRSGVTLGWIRIEPHTIIHDIAVKEKVINQDTDLLPDDEENLVKLFYMNSSKIFDIIAISILNFIEGLIKPLVKRVLSSNDG